MVWTNTCSAGFYKQFAKRRGTEDYEGRQSSLDEFAAA